jgi:hypothetical protein
VRELSTQNTGGREDSTHQNPRLASSLLPLCGRRHIASVIGPRRRRSLRTVTPALLVHSSAAVQPPSSSQHTNTCFCLSTEFPKETDVYPEADRICFISIQMAIQRYQTPYALTWDRRGWLVLYGPRRLRVGWAAALLFGRAVVVHPSVVYGLRKSRDGIQSGSTTPKTTELYKDSILKPRSIYCRKMAAQEI